MISIRNQIAVVVYLRESGSLRPLDQAEVAVTDVAQTFSVFAQKKNGGIYYFLDLAAGDYVVNASLPSKGSRYGYVEQGINVSYAANGDVNRVSLGLELAPTSISGAVRNNNSEGIVLANVRIKGGVSSAVTNSLGEYTLRGVEVGTQTLLVSAVDYAATEQEVTLLEAGDAIVQDVVLL